MNFLFCNRCNKKSEDNITNFNTSELLPKNNKQNLINSNIINNIEKIEKFQNLNIGEKITTSLNNLNNLEEDSNEKLEIIEYPYSKKEPLWRLHFKNNMRKFNNCNILERDILSQLYYSDNNRSNSQSQSKKNNFKRHLEKITNIKTTKEDIESKDTMSDPANLALKYLFQDINKNNHINKFKDKSKNYKEEEDDVIVVEDEIERNKLILKSINDKINSKIRLEKNNNFIKKNKKVKNNLRNKNNLYKNNHNKINSNSKNKENYINERNQRKKSAKNKNVYKYINNIIRKKKMLKNKLIINNNKTTIGIKALSFNSTKKFPKSNSFNLFKSEKKSDRSNEVGNNLTYKKKYNNLCNNIFRNIIVKSSSKNKSSNLKITHKRVIRTPIPIEKV